MRLEHMCLKGSFNSLKACMTYPAKQNVFHWFIPNCQVLRLLYSRLPEISLLSLNLQSFMKGKKKKQTNPQPKQFPQKLHSNLGKK